MHEGYHKTYSFVLILFSDNEESTKKIVQMVA